MRRGPGVQCHVALCVVSAHDHITVGDAGSHGTTSSPLKTKTLSCFGLHADVGMGVGRRAPSWMWVYDDMCLTWIKADPHGHAEAVNWPFTFIHDLLCNTVDCILRAQTDMMSVKQCDSIKTGCLRGNQDEQTDSTEMSLLMYLRSEFGCWTLFCSSLQRLQCIWKTHAGDRDQESWVWYQIIIIITILLVFLIYLCVYLLD